MIVWVLVILTVILWILGGQWKGKIRDIGVPILLGIGIGFAIKDTFAHRLLYGIISCGCANIIRLGYGNYED